MLLDGFFETLNEFTKIIKKKIRGIYQNSSLYEKKISKTFNNEFIYKPSPHLLSSIIKYQNKKIYKGEKIADIIIKNPKLIKPIKCPTKYNSCAIDEFLIIFLVAAKAR